MHPELEQILQRLWTVSDGPDGWRPKTSRIGKELLLEWMASEDLEVLGHLHYLLTDKRFQIEPALSDPEHRNFCRRYYFLCLLQNVDGEWAHNRYEAAWALAKWFAQLWDDPGVPQLLIDGVKEELAQLYILGDQAMRRCLMNAIIEPLFDKNAIMIYFADWQSHPVLNQAYRDVAFWKPKRF